MQRFSWSLGIHMVSRSLLLRGRGRTISRGAGIRTGAMAGALVFDAIRINWFLGILALELWVAAWYVAYEADIRRWWRRRRMAKRWRTRQATPRPRRQDRPA